MPQRPEREYRTIPCSALELRNDGGAGMTVEGYATTFNQPYELYRNADGVVLEQVAPDAFAETDMKDVIMQYDHQGRVFARLRNGTLAITPDAHGLHIRAHLGGTEIGRQLYEEIAGGYTDRMSFGFTVAEQEKRTSKNPETGEVTVLRTITKIRKLYDVSAVSIPANDTTEITARALWDGVIAEAAEELRQADTNPVEVSDMDETETRAEAQETPAAEPEEIREVAEEAEAPEEPAAEERAVQPEAVQTAEADLAEAGDETRENMAAMEARKAVAEGEGSVLSVHTDKEEHPMTELEIRSSAEYVDAFARYIRSGDPRECRTLLKTENASGSVPVPVLVDEIIRHAWENEQILSRVRKTNFRGNLKVAFERSADGAYVHTEGSTAPTEEDLALGIVTMTPANIKKWIHITDEDIAMGGEAFVRYIYEEISYQIMKKLSALVVGDIVALQTSNQTTSVGAARITAAPSLTCITEAFANLSDEAENPVVIMNKLTYANFQAAYAAGNFAIDPFRGMTVLFSSALPAYDTATGGTDDYCIVGDLRGAQVNFPEGEGLVLKWDDLSEAEKDLVKVVGRIYAAHAVTAPFRFCRIKKPSAAT